MKTKNILILCEGNLKRDPRVLKQILSFQEIANIYTVGDSPSGLEDYFFNLHPKVTDIRDTFFTKLKRVIPYFFNYMEYYTCRGEVMRQVVYNIKSKNVDFDLIIGNELRPLPIAFAVASKNTKIHFDAHEFYLNDTMPNSVNEMYHKYDRHLLMNYAIKAHTMSTVCSSIAENYTKMLKKEVVILENVPLYVDQLPQPVDPEDIKISYHGIVMKNRCIDKIIKVFLTLPQNYSLHLALVPFAYEPNTFKEIMALALSNSRIHLYDAYPMETIANDINKFDICLHYLENHSKNFEYALPNKFFEGIQGRLCLAVTPNYEMKRIINIDSVGVVADNYDIINLFDKIRELTPEQIFAYKQNSHKVAKQYSFETIKKNYQKLLN